MTIKDRFRFHRSYSYEIFKNYDEWFNAWHNNEIMYEYTKITFKRNYFKGFM
jgi:hypothetical protein